MLLLPDSIVRRLRVALLISIVPALITACGGGGGSGNATPPLTLQPTSATLGVGTTQKFEARGGQSPYSYSVTSGTGTIDSTGLFTAPASAGTATVRVSDASGANATASVTINAALAMNAGAITMTASSGQSFQFSGTGGSGGGYQYTLVSGSGGISASGLYTVGNSAGRDKVQVRDSQGATASSTVEVLRVRTNGAVNSIVTSGSALYLGGSFSAVNPYLTSQMAVLDPSTGKPQLQCDLNTGFDAPVQKILLVNNALYVGGEFTSYKGQPAFFLAKLDATTCALDTTFTQPVGFAGASDPGPFQTPIATFVRAIAVSGSSLFVAGSFTSYRGLPAQNLAKLDLQTGALDQTFTATSGADEFLTALAVSTDSVYVSGALTHYRGTAVTQWWPMKLNINSGAIDPTFHVAPVPAGSFVSALLYSVTSLYVAGYAVTFANGPGGTTPLGLYKLDATTGQQDTAFTPPADQHSPVVDCVAASGQSLYVGGSFNISNGTSTYTNVVKLDATTGQLDSSFNPGAAPGELVQSIAISGSSIYLVGAYYPFGTQKSAGLKKVDATTGAPDPTFGLTPGLGGTPFSVAVGTNGLYVGGAISGYGGAPAANIAKMDTTSGIPDAAFDTAAGTDGPINKLLLSSSSLYLAGEFYRYGGVEADLIAKADANTGVPDATFMQGGGFTLIPQRFDYGYFTASVNALALSGTSLYVGGHFTDYRGQAEGDLAKIDASSGALDATFAQGGAFLPTPRGTNSTLYTVTGLAVTQNALYVAGDFALYRGAPVSSPLLKLDLSSGAVDTAFTPPVSFGPPFTVPSNTALLPSGNSLYLGNAVADLGGGVTSVGVAKLDAASGAVDRAFAQAVALKPRGTGPNAFASVSDLVLSGSSLYVAGDFEHDLGSGGSGAINLIKVDAVTGALDTTFSQPYGPNGAVNSVFLGGSSLYVGGAFSNYRGKPACFSALLDPATGANQDSAGL